MRKEIVGDAIKGAQWLRWGILEHSKKHYGRHAVEDGSIIIEIEPEYVRVIMPDMAGFQMWPRYGDIKNLTVESTSGDTYDLKVTEFGGTYIGENGSSVIYDRSSYPMTFDETRGTFVAQVSEDTESGDKTTEVIFNGGFMANCFWTDGVDKVLNWRGTPNRHFAPDSTYSIPGVSNGAITFGTWIYEGGEQLIEAPDGAFVTGAFYYNKILHCISYLSGKERIHIFVDSEWSLKAERSGGSLNIPCFISIEGNRFVSGDGTSAIVNDDSVIWTTSLVQSSGSCSYVWGNPNTLTANGTQSLWPELDDVVTINTIASSVTIADSGGTSTNKTVPVKLMGSLANYIRVTLEADTSVYLAIYGTDPPEGASIFTAKAEPNGRYCSITWNSVPINGCIGPTSYQVSSDGTAIAGYYQNIGCSGVNFYLTATTDTGATGNSGNLNDSNCNQSGTKQIISLGNGVYGYTGTITSLENPLVTWTISSGKILGANNQPTVQISLDACVTVILDVVGACGSISHTFDVDSLPVSISGTATPAVGSGYSLTNGIGTINWSFTGGAINSSGTITSITGCGTQTISATDSCGSSAAKSVRLPSGLWTLASDDYLCSDYGTAYEVYIGADNLYYNEWGHYVADFNLPYQHVSCPLSANPKFPFDSGYGYDLYFKVYHRKVYSWECP